MRKAVTLLLVVALWLSVAIFRIEAQTLLRTPVSPPPITVSSVSTPVAQLIASGKEVAVTLRGTNLNLITSVQTMFSGVVASDVQTRVISAGATAFQVGLIAGAKARPGTYSARLSYLSGGTTGTVLSVDVPVSVFKIDVELPVRLTSAELTMSGFALNGSGLISMSSPPYQSQVFDGTADITRFVTEKSDTRIVMSNYPLNPGIHSFRVRLGYQEAAYSFDYKAPTITSVDRTLNGFVLNGSGLMATGAAAPPTYVWDGGVNLTTYVTEKSATRIVVSNYAPYPSPLNFKVRVGHQEGIYVFDYRAPTITGINQTGPNSYEIIGSGFGTNVQILSVEESAVSASGAILAVVQVPSQSIALAGDTRLTVSRLPDNRQSNTHALMVKVGQLSDRWAGVRFAYQPEITGITFTDQGWELKGVRLPPDLGSSYAYYYIDGQLLRPSVVQVYDSSAERKFLVRTFLPAGNHTHQIVTNNPEPYRTSNTYTATHPIPPASIYSGFYLPPIPRDVPAGSEVVVDFAGHQLPFPLGPALSFRLVEAGKTLKSSVREGSDFSVGAAILEIPADAPLGYVTLEASIYSFTTSTHTNVVPSPLPAITEIIGGVRNSTGELYVKPGDALTIKTTGRFDYAEMYLQDTGAWRNVRKGTSGEIIYAVPSVLTVVPVWGTKQLQVNFCVDSQPPSSQFTLWMGTHSCWTATPTSVFYANVPLLTVAQTLGAPNLGFVNPVFLNVDFVIEGKDLNVPGFNTVVTMGGETLLTQPGSTAERLIVRVPASSVSTGGILTVNNGMLTSLPGGYQYGSKVDVQVFRPKIEESISPQAVPRGAPCRVTIRGKWLGFLTESVSLNGVPGTIVTRYDTGIDVELPSGISTGTILVRTKAGDAPEVNPGYARLVVY